MGGVVNSKFQPNNSVAGRNDIAMSVFHEIGFSDDDLNKFWNEFMKMDTKKCGAITRIELFRYFTVEENDLTTKLFKSFDIDNSGKLDFCEFTLNFWNFLTIELYYLPTFLFYTFDDDNNGTLDFFEVQALVETLHGEKNVHISEIVSKLQDKTPIDQAQFRK
jgi:Ca2+-binding EF-hand superfamily protein